MRFARHAYLFIALAYVCIAAQCISAGDLVARYQKEKNPLVKRDLALKMIDTGILELHKSKADDLAAIFGPDWWPAGRESPGISRGFVFFARQPFSKPSAEQWEKETEPVQHALVGWYLVVHYGTEDHTLLSWWLSNVPKPNHTMRPTAGRGTVQFCMTNTRSFQIIHGSASGG